MRKKDTTEKKLSLKATIMILFTAGSALLVIFFGVLSVAIARNEWLEDLTESASMRANQINEKAEMLFDELFSKLELFDNSTTRNFLNKYGYHYNTSKALVQMITLYRESNMLEGVKDIYVLRTDDWCMSEHAGLHKIEQMPVSIHMMEIAITLPDSTSIVTVDDGNADLVLTKTIYELVSRRVLGYIVLRFDGKNAATICNQAYSSDSGEFVLVDSRLNVLPAVKDNELRQIVQNDLANSPSSSFSYVRNQHLFIVSSVKANGWRIAGTVELDFIRQIYQEISRIWILAMLIWMGILILMVSFISRRVTHPIAQLKNTMQKAQAGDLQVRAEVNGTSEISQLAAGFNAMMDQIKHLMEQERMEQEKSKKMELARLQAEINPHFLYNTLETVIWLTADQRYDEAIEMTGLLASFFRLGLSGGADFVKISQEVEHAESYLQIMSARYNDQIEYEFDVSPELFDYSILKLTLQPIIENAIYHGIVKKREAGKISIRGRAESGMIVFTITDNGEGIQKTELDRINRMLSGDASLNAAESEGYGLYNVNQRIKLHYGGLSGLTVKSEPGQGTEVTIKIQRMEYDV